MVDNQLILVYLGADICIMSVIAGITGRTEPTKRPNKMLLPPWV